MTLMQHFRKWKTCKLCHLCENRRNVVTYRGEDTCDVLFVGEAPGLLEDRLASPFVGPAGRLLDKMIEAVRQTERFVPGITNIVGCIPKNGVEVVQPDKEAITKCRPRLEEIIDLTTPRAIVTLGEVASQNLPEVEIETYNLPHPAFILRTERSRFVQETLRFTSLLLGIVEKINAQLRD